jgi:hypothetical protein
MSSLLELDHSLVPSETATSSIDHSKKTSPIWKHSRRPLPDEDEALLYCLYCQSDSFPLPYGTTSAGNLRKHILRHHPLICLEPINSKSQEKVTQQIQGLYRQAQALGDTEEFDLQVLERQLDQRVLIEALIALIVVRNVSYNMVEWPEFHTLCQILNKACKGMLPTSHSTAAIKVKESWVRHKDTVRRVLQSAISHIHISLDIWTSPNRLLLLAICAHFTSYEFKRQKVLLALKPVYGHSGEEQFKVLLPVLHDYGIVRKLGAIVGDNASTNGTLCKAIQVHWKQELDIEWNAQQMQIRCIGHIINLVVQAFLFSGLVEMEELESYEQEEEEGTQEMSDDERRRVKFRLLGPLGKAHNIVAHIRKSPARTAEWIGLAKRMIPMDNRTRWNSWYGMLTILIEKMEHVDKYCRNHEEDLTEDFLSHKDWKKLCMTRDFLATFARATLFAEGASTSIDRTLFVMDILIKHLHETIVSLLLSFFLLVRAKLNII